jgi:hypothetical protein
MFGPPVPIREDEVGQVVVGIDTTDSAGRPTGKEVSLGGEEFRRSVYVQVRRSKPLALLDMFDKPAMEPNCEVRASSTVAPQALLLMNNEFVVTHARHFAERVRRDSGTDATRQVVRAWQLAFAREPTDDEAKQATALVVEQADRFRAVAEPAEKPASSNAAAKPDAQVQALALLCQALLSANEFLYVD